MIIKIFHVIKDFKIFRLSIVADNNFENIMLCKQLKNKIMESKDKLLIAKYIILTNYIELMNKIFGGISLFEDFCKINENSINISNGEIVKFLNKFKFNYVDANIDDYLKSDIPNATLQ